MLCEVLLLANPYVLIPGEGGAMRTMAECPSDMIAYCKLGEYILKQIEHSHTIELFPARLMIERIRNRDLFPFVGEVLLSSVHEGIEFEVVSHVLSFIAKERTFKLKNRKRNRTESSVLDPGNDYSSSEILSDPGTLQTDSNVPGDKDVICTVVKMGYGKGGGKDLHSLTALFKPIKHRMSDGESDSDGEHLATDQVSSTVKEYSGDITGLDKENWIVGVAIPESVSRLIPLASEEYCLRVYCRYKRHVGKVTRAFDKWLAFKHLPKENEKLSPLRNKK